MRAKVEELVNYIKKNGEYAIVTKNPVVTVENVKSTKEDTATMVNAYWTSDFKKLLKKNKLWGTCLFCQKGFNRANVAQKHILQVECPILRKQLQKHPEQEEDQQAANKEEVNDGENQVEIAEEEETRREPQKHFSEEIVKEKEAQIPDWPREEEVEMTRFNLRRRESTIYDFAPSDSEEDLSSGEDSDIFDPKGEEETDFDLNTPQKRNRESSDEEMIPGSPIYLSPSPHVAGSRSSKYFEPSMKKLKELDPLQNASTVSNSLHLKPQEQIDTEEPAKKKIQNTKTATVSNSLQQLAQEELVSNQNVSETSDKDNPDHFSQPTDLEKLSSSRIVQEKEDQYSQPLEIVQEKEDQYSQPLEIVQDTSEKEEEKASYNIFYGEVSIRIKSSLRMWQTFDISSFYHNISSSLLFY